MKVLGIFLVVVVLATSVPQARKDFHEHFDNFFEIIFEEVGNELNELMEEYKQYDEFASSVNYLKTAEFRNIVYEMEDLPEFKAVIEFLEKDNIDIIVLLDRFHNFIDGIGVPDKRLKKSSGKDMTSFVLDIIELFPTDKLDALFHEKMANDEAFRVAMDNLYSKEWQEIYASLWTSEEFANEVRILNDHGINVDILYLQIKAIFGQN